jgi:hypothetical protein
MSDTSSDLEALNKKFQALDAEHKALLLQSRANARTPQEQKKKAAAAKKLLELEKQIVKIRNRILKKVREQKPPEDESLVEHHKDVSKSVASHIESPSPQVVKNTPPPPEEPPQPPLKLPPVERSEGASQEKTQSSKEKGGSKPTPQKQPPAEKKTSLPTPEMASNNVPNRPMLDALPGNRRARRVREVDRKYGVDTKPPFREPERFLPTHQPPGTDVSPGFGARQPKEPTVGNSGKPLPPTKTLEQKVAEFGKKVPKFQAPKVEKKESWFDRASRDALDFVHARLGFPRDNRPSEGKVEAHRLSDDSLSAFPNQSTAVPRASGSGKQAKPNVPISKKGTPKTNTGGLGGRELAHLLGGGRGSSGGRGGSGGNGGGGGGGGSSGHGPGDNGGHRRGSSRNGGTLSHLFQGTYIETAAEAMHSPIGAMDRTAAGMPGGGAKTLLDGAGKLFGGPMGTGPVVDNVTKFGKVVIDAAEKLRKWGDGLHNVNMQFSEFSAAMAGVQSRQEVRDIQLSTKRGDRTAGSAEELAGAKHKFAEETSKWSDIGTSIGNKIVAGLSEWAGEKLSKFGPLADKILQWLNGDAQSGNIQAWNGYMQNQASDALEASAAENKASRPPHLR